MIVISGPTLSFDLSFFGNSFDLSQDACFFFFFISHAYRINWVIFVIHVYTEILGSAHQNVYSIFCVLSLLPFYMYSKFIIVYRNIILVSFVLPSNVLSVAVLDRRG